MATSGDIEQTQQLLEQKLAKRMEEFELELMAVKENPQNIKIEALVRDYQEFKNFTVEMLSLLRQQIAQLQYTVEQLETRNRGDCLVLKGVTENPGENLRQVVADVLRQKLDIPEVNAQVFSSCYRLGGISQATTRSVLVRFYDCRLRQQVWNSKTKFKGSPYSCSEFLIRCRQLLFVEARKRFGVRDCWTQDGCIVVKLSNGSRRKIFTQADLAVLTAAQSEPTPPAPLQNERQVHKDRPRRLAKK